MNDPIKFHVIAYQEAEVWLAQGVEYDILARAESFDLLPKAFSEAIAKTVAIGAAFDREPLAGIKPAPAKFKHCPSGGPCAFWQDCPSFGYYFR
jgi:hypothetical protein